MRRRRPSRRCRPAVSAGRLRRSGTVRRSLSRRRPPPIGRDCRPDLYDPLVGFVRPFGRICTTLWSDLYDPLVGFVRAFGWMGRTNFAAKTTSRRHPGTASAGRLRRSGTVQPPWSRRRRPSIGCDCQQDLYDPLVGFVRPFGWICTTQRVVQATQRVVQICGADDRPADTSEGIGGTSAQVRDGAAVDCAAAVAANRP